MSAIAVAFLNLVILLRYCGTVYTMNAITTVHLRHASSSSENVLPPSCRSAAEARRKCTFKLLYVYKVLVWLRPGGVVLRRRV